LAKLGTLTWLERTGGKLAWYDRLALMAQAVKARAATRRRIEAGCKVRNRRAHIAAQAIALHLNVMLDARHGKEAQMLRAGSGGDVAGLGLDVLHTEQIESVVAHFPRFDLKHELTRTLAIEAQARPGCRIAFLQNKLGFAQLIRDAPLFRE
jgi:hypothetical protein